MSIRNSFFALMFVFAAAPASAMPLNQSYFAPESEASLLKDIAVNFEGIIALNNCSGSLVRFATSSDDDKAMVLTNGHCIGGGFLNPGEVRVNKPVSRSFQVLRASDGQTIGTLSAETVLYATMTRTDITLYRVKQTYKQILASMGIHAITLADRPLTDGEKIEIISGFWHTGYDCMAEKTIPTLREGDYTFNESVRYSRPGCETIHGTSGSPVLLAATREVIAINNTGNDDGQKCTLNNPCEVDAQGNIFYQKGYSYAQQTYWLYTCLNANRQLDLAMPGCLLPK